ncbi:Rya-R [Mytilus coruscus]|uniref:Rya-R n=1 Tax=Mytilus coruscus TaxID=42192 RepID=A0A6J8E3B6_MYTCO|nr:Rya-R [Mytilus coruscus]
MNFRGLNLTLENKSFWDKFGDLLRPVEDEFFEMYDLPLLFIVPLLLLYGIVVVISLGGNIAVCYTLCNGKVLITVTNFFLASLSVSDILMTILCIPATVVSDIIYKYWVLGSFMCHVVHYLQLVAVLQRAFSVVAITCDRHFIISRPFKQRMTKKTARLLVLLLWIFAFIIALPSAWYSQVIYLQYHPGSHGLCIELWDDQQLQHIYSITILLLQYFMPLLIMICVYVHIGYIIWIKPTPGEADKVRDKRIALSKRKQQADRLQIQKYFFSVFPSDTLQINAKLTEITAEQLLNEEI